MLKSPNPRASTFGSDQHPPQRPQAQRWVLDGSWASAFFLLISLRDADIKG